MPQAILYDYYRSSAAYRVRIALNLKGIDYEQRPVNLLESQQTTDGYRALNPQGFVPMLEIDGHRLTQSLAIINYLDLRFPNPPLIPAPAAERAQSKMAISKPAALAPGRRSRRSRPRWIRAMRAAANSGCPKPMRRAAFIRMSKA